jgi:hypothetical protein
MGTEKVKLHYVYLTSSPGKWNAVILLLVFSKKWDSFASIFFGMQ